MTEELDHRDEYLELDEEVIGDLKSSIVASKFGGSLPTFFRLRTRKKQVMKALAT